MTVLINGDLQCEELTKRELFAAMAMQGLLSCNETYGEEVKYAKLSVAIADSLLKELNR